jgi:hypothetical protein
MRYDRDALPQSLDVGRLLDVDAYSFEFRLSHIAKHVQLPPPPAVPSQAHLPREDRLPTLLVVNMQMPDYPVTADWVLTHCVPGYSCTPAGMPAARHPSCC